MPSETLQLFMLIESCAIVRMCTKHDHPSQLSSKWADGRMRGFSLSKSQLLTKRKQIGYLVFKKIVLLTVSFTTLRHQHIRIEQTIRNINNSSICTVASGSPNNSQQEHLKLTSVGTPRFLNSTKKNNVPSLVCSFT